MIEHFEAENPTAFDAAYATAKARATQLDVPFFLYIRAPWCGDCRRTEGTVKSALAARPTPAVVLTVHIPDSVHYRTASFPYRHNPIINLTRIPTLMRDGGHRLVEMDCYDPQAVQQFANQSL